MVFQIFIAKLMDLKGLCDDMIFLSLFPSTVALNVQNFPQTPLHLSVHENNNKKMEFRTSKH